MRHITKTGKKRRTEERIMANAYIEKKTAFISASTQSYIPTHFGSLKMLKQMYTKFKVPKIYAKKPSPTDLTPLKYGGWEKKERTTKESTGSREGVMGVIHRASV